MNRRVCIIGNSALACIKLAWDQAMTADVPSTSMTFFGSSQYSVDCLQLVGRRLVPTEEKVAAQFAMTSGGSREIELDRFDHFIVYGVSFEYRDFLRIFRTHALVEDMDLAPDKHLLSAACLDRTVLDLKDLRPGFRIASDISNATTAPISIVPAPGPSEIVLDEPQFGLFKPLAESEFVARIWARYCALAKKYAAEQGYSTALQAEETFAFPGFTAERYSVGAVGLPQDAERAMAKGKWHREARVRDPWHMNADFGKTVLRDILALT